jgi:retron-type reverse transcriptase
MSATPQTTDLVTVWRSIRQVGGIDAYVTAELTRRGVLAPRRETDGMSDRELTAYKASLKAEAAERRKVRRDAWRAYKASHIVHLGEGIFWTDEPATADGGKEARGYDKWDVPHAEERAAENELPPLDTPQQLAEALGLTIGQLRQLCFHRDVATTLNYRRFTLPKRNGSARAIWAPLPRLKAAQRWVLHNVVERLRVHGAVHGFFAGRSTVTNAQRHAASRVVVKMDLKDFFPTITVPRVKGLFRKAGYRERIATLLALLCTESPREVVTRDGNSLFVSLGPRCLPQGAPTSPAITNALCLRMDRRIAGAAHKLGWRYTRYADDMTFSLPLAHKGKPHLGVLLGLVRKVVEEEGFTVHPDKTRVARAGGRQTVTGLVVNGADASPRVPRELRRQLRAAAHNLESGKPLKQGESLARLAGYAAYVYATDAKVGARLLESFARAMDNAAR